MLRISTIEPRPQRNERLIPPPINQRKATTFTHMHKLSIETTERIKSLCADAYQAYDEGDYRKALRLFYQGWVLLPKPQTQFREAGWLLVGIGDSYYRLKQYTPGCEALRSADHCPEAKNNPFIHLRLGQCLFRIGEKRSARSHLHKAYQLAGDSIFQTEASCYLDSIADLT